MGSKWVTYFWIAKISFHSTRVVTVSLCSSTCAFSVKICLRKYIMAATWWVWNWKLGVHFICLHISLWYSLWVSHWEFDSQWQQISSSAVVCLVMCTARWFKHDWQSKSKPTPLLLKFWRKKLNNKNPEEWNFNERNVCKWALNLAYLDLLSCLEIYTCYFYILCEDLYPSY